ncbi:fungal-specific transcription factor domain-containing protein [Lasiosphaeria miniovina]|uniref:Fungal-specific transcription factor domain-containing protein n=1 Tax=Lasiosphaeria miniovina TaxID=1954250 RepID=A0AA40BI98_9PEZI|nr:fungal-specific transcription factor domain-containing protein [Lasiosphaeria miniovina]KAK0734726.1 fungal-specific transcription factor domain-containing protein [Lasiosphaeria miniovina]
MATMKTRSSEGCWTCRLRRKKCDELRPLCGGCALLEIDCLYCDEKPEWMDGGQRQKEKADQLKTEVKRKANQRRERRYLYGLEMDLEALDVSQLDDSDNQPSTAPEFVLASLPPPNTAAAAAATATATAATAASAAAAAAAASASAAAAAVFAAPLSSVSPGTLHSGSESGSRRPDSSPSFPSAMTPSTSANSDSSVAGLSPPRDECWTSMPFNDTDLHGLMLYLDHVFPFLFPFYRPPLLDSGRGWLLVMLNRNKSLLHTALSLASYFFNVVLSHVTGLHESCREHNGRELQRQQELALQELRRDMNDTVSRGVKGYLAETTQVMASVIQLLSFEVAIANTGNWVMHLEAAAELYNEMVKHHGTAVDGEASDFCFTYMLVQLGSKPFMHTPKNHPWSPDQASLRFFTACLLFFDTIASTALEQPPRLLYLHRSLLTEPDEETRRLMSEAEKEYHLPHIDLLEFLGLRNWVVISIAEIAALDASKKEAKKAGSLSMTQLVVRATAIEQGLRNNIQTLSSEPCNEPQFAMYPTKSLSDDPIMQFAIFGNLYSPQVLDMTSAISGIWAQAALTYLNVVVSGWQPASPEIRTSVTLTIQMLRSLKSPSYLRSVVWPFTVTGCMAAPEEEQTFRDMVAAMGPLQLFGSIREALAIMEKVWANRVQIEENADQWDLAACLRVLGRPALLV